MYYYNTITNEYPRYTGDLELLGWAQKSPLPEGWVEVDVDSVEMPNIQSDDLVETGPPVQNPDGSWKASWAVRKRTQQEIFMAKIVCLENKALMGENLTPEEVLFLKEYFTV